MNSILIASIMLIIIVAMFFSSRFENGVVAMTGGLLFALFGFISFSDLFARFVSGSIILMLGMMVIGGGLFHTGFAGWLGKKLVLITGKGEFRLQVISIIAGALLSSVASGSASMMILFPIISSICIASEVSMSKVVLPMSLGIGAGSFMTLTGSGMTIATSTFLEQSGYAGLTYFEPTKIGLVSLAAQFLGFAILGRKLLPNTQVKPDAAIALKAESLPENFTPQMGISALILLLTIIGMVIDSDIMPMEVCAGIGALVSVFTGCLNEKEMWSSISWSTIAVIGGVSAVGKGIQGSGLGEIIANSVLQFLGNNASPLMVVIVLILATGLISQFMSNNAACALMLPIALSLGLTLNMDPRAFVIAVMFGSGIGILTVMATPSMAFIMDIGHYSPKDFLKWGISLVVPNALAVITMIGILYL